MNNEINLNEFFDSINNSKKLIFTVILICTIFGIGIAIFSENKYFSSTVFITQQDNSMGNNQLSGVASIVGFNLGNSNLGGEIPSSMYPKITESVKFKRLLLEKIIDEKKNISLKQFLLESYDIEDYEKPININTIYVSKNEMECFDILSKILEIAINLQDNFITISTTSSKPEYSAKITQFAKEILQNIIIENKIESAKQTLNFTEEQLRINKKVFDEIQSKISDFKDSNLNNVNSMKINELSKLEAEFQIINSVVTELSKQVAQAKLQVSKETPVFLTIKEATVSLNKKSPNRILIVLCSTLIGLFLGIILVLLRHLK